MISLLTSSKTMDFDQPAPRFAPMTDVLFPDQAAAVGGVLSGYDADSMAKLMNISDMLSRHVTSLYSNPNGIRKPAIYAYRGDVYRGFGVDSLNQDDIEWANKHILIPSGLYGLVRPCDGIEQYRLEMKTKLSVDNKKSLYEFWGDKLAKYVESVDKTVLVLASSEYAKAVVPKLSTEVRVVEVVFMDRTKNGDMKTVPIYSKIMRGVMASYIVKHRIDSVEDLYDFRQQGYELNKSRSYENKLVFSRAKPTAIVT